MGTKKCPRTALGRLLALSWELLERLLGPLGASWAPLGRLLALLGVPKAPKGLPKASQRHPKGLPKASQRSPKGLPKPPKGTKKILATSLSLGRFSGKLVATSS